MSAAAYPPEPGDADYHDANAPVCWLHRRADCQPCAKHEATQ